MTINEEISKYEAEYAAACAEHDAARAALDAYEMNPDNWKRPDYNDRWMELHEAICTAADKTREPYERLRAAKAKKAATTPMGRFFAEMKSLNK